VFLVTKKPTGTKSKSSNQNQNQNQNWILFPPSTGPRTGIKFYLKWTPSSQFYPEEWIIITQETIQPISPKSEI
jgi:hypothetical protein